ncbi:hypothetical protein MHYP_G00301600 [Metynnis hypsauchen]
MEGSAELQEKRCRVFPLMENEVRCCLPVVFLLLVQKVSLQDVQAVVGDAVILPCSSSDKALQDKVAVFWRFQDSFPVYDIVDGRANSDEQAASYKNRVESFPAEWTNGNFSIKLRDVRKTDGGPYTCFLPTIHVKMEVQLTVKGVSSSHANGQELEKQRRQKRIRP